MNGVFGKNCVFCGYEGLYWLVENGVENWVFLIGFEKWRFFMGDFVYGILRNVFMWYVVELNVEVFINLMIVLVVECIDIYWFWYKILWNKWVIIVVIVK